MGRVNRGRALKPMYTVTEIAELLGRSRWAVRRWLERHKIPYVQAEPGEGRRGSQIYVLLSDLRTHHASLFASIQEALENHSDDAA